MANINDGTTRRAFIFRIKYTLGNIYKRFTKKRREEERKATIIYYIFYCIRECKICYFKIRWKMEDLKRNAYEACVSGNNSCPLQESKDSILDIF